MILLKLSDAKRVEYVTLSQDGLDILRSGLVVYKHYVTRIDKTSWLPIPEMVGRSFIKFGDITIEFMNVSSETIKALHEVGAFKRNSLYDVICRSVKMYTDMQHLKEVYEYIKLNETESNFIYMKALKKSCDLLVL